MDADLASYFGRIEARFCGRRGAPLLLSPLDFQKALEWYAEGVPADAVEEGVDRYFDHLDARRTPRRNALCLSFAERHILKVLEEKRASRIGRAAGAEETGAGTEAARRFLESRLAAIASFTEDPLRTEPYPVLTKALEGAAATLRGLLPRAAESFASLERTLKPLDDEVVRLALLESPGPRADAWRRSAAERLRPYAGGMEETALRAQVEQLARCEAMRELGLPRLSLLFWEGGE